MVCDRQRLGDNAEFKKRDLLDKFACRLRISDWISESKVDFPVPCGPTMAKHFRVVRRCDWLDVCAWERCFGGKDGSDAMSWSTSDWVLAEEPK